MDTVTIAVLAGTTREQRVSIHAARMVAEIGRSLPNVTILFVDPTDFVFAGDGNDAKGKDPRYTEITRQADAFFIVTPEYNHSFPGSLKRMLDSELENYLHKPVALAGASSGRIGGARAVEALLSPLREMGMVATFNDVYFPKVQDLFDAEGTFTGSDYYPRAIAAAYTELLWMARALKTAKLSQ